jgi:HSP20 family molecular chaperone IbpA
MTQDSETKAMTTKERRPVVTPRTEILETKDDVVLVAEMPGVDETSVEVTLEDDVLTIRGKTEDPALEGHRRVYAEFERGDYERSFALTDGADAGKIEASVKNGLLRVRVPKARPASRKIPVAGPKA